MRIVYKNKLTTVIRIFLVLLIHSFGVIAQVPADPLFFMDGKEMNLGTHGDTRIELRASNNYKVFNETGKALDALVFINWRTISGENTKELMVYFKTKPKPFVITVAVPAKLIGIPEHAQRMTLSEKKLALPERSLVFTPINVGIDKMINRSSIEEDLVRFDAFGILADLGKEIVIKEVIHLKDAMPLAVIPYADEIKKTALRHVDLTFLIEPLTYKEFEVIFNQPEKYLDSALRYLKEEQFNEVEFNAVVLSMVRLKPKDYLLFLEKCIESYHKKMVDDETMVSILFGAHGNQYLKNHYDYPSVQALLEKFMDDSRTSERLRADARELKEGKIPKNWDSPFDNS